MAPRPGSLAAHLPKPLNPEWLAQLERLRNQPRSGEVSTGTLQAGIADIFSDSSDLRAKAEALAVEYEKALNERAAKWENELKDLRAQYDAKTIAELPEAKRAEAQKFLDAARASLDREPCAGLP